MALPIAILRMAGAQGSLGLVANGDFSNGSTGWSAGNGATITVAGGVATVKQTGSSSGWVYASFSCTPGATYRVTYDMNPGTGTAGAVNINTSGVFGGSSVATSSTNGNGVQFTFVASAATLYVRLYCASGSTNKTMLFDNIIIEAV